MVEPSFNKIQNLAEFQKNLELDKNKILGKGAQAIVYEARSKMDEKLCAAKIYWT